MVRVQRTYKGQYFITIPIHVVNALEIKKGTEIEFVTNLKGGSIEMKKRE